MFLSKDLLYLCFRQSIFDTFFHFSGDALLKVSRASVELLQDRELLEITEEILSVAVGSVVSKHFATRNNRLLSTFDDKNAQMFGLMVDVEKVFVGVMEKFFLPLRYFELANEKSLVLLLIISNDSPVGFILEVVLHYPYSPHNLLKDFPLAPTKDTIVDEMLSDLQMSLLEKNGQKRVSVKTFEQRFNQKKNHTVQYITLKFIVNLGITFSESHRILNFSPEKRKEP